MKYIEKIEGVQRRATKQIPSLKGLSYSERLRTLKLPTLAYRRIRGDMLEIYKILHEHYDPKSSNIITLWKDVSERQGQRGNSLKIYPQHMHMQFGNMEKLFHTSGSKDLEQFT